MTGTTSPKPPGGPPSPGADYCWWCGTTSGLHWHHIKYRSQGGKNNPENLARLCHLCHNRAHSSKRRWQPVLLEVARMRAEGVMVSVPQAERWMRNGH